MVSCEVQRCKVLISELIAPDLLGLLHWLLIFVKRKVVSTAMLVNNPEALSVVFERSEGQRCVLTSLLDVDHIDFAARSVQVLLESFVFVFCYKLKDHLRCVACIVEQGAWQLLLARSARLLTLALGGAGRA